MGKIKLVYLLLVFCSGGVILSGSNLTYTEEALSNSSDNMEAYYNFGLKLSAPLAIHNRYNRESFYVASDQNEAMEWAKEILSEYWEINSRYKLLNSIDDVYSKGVKSSYISALNNILGKKDLLVTPDELLKKETWANEKINYSSISYIVNFGEYITYKDLYTYDLSRISLLGRLGVSAGFITLEEGRKIVGRAAMEFGSYRGGWYEIGREITAATSYIYRNSKYIKGMNRLSSQSVMDLLDSNYWIEEDWQGIRGGELTIDVTIDTPQLNEIPAHSSIRLSFDQNRDSYDLIGSYMDEYYLYKAVMGDDYSRVKDLIVEDEYIDGRNITGKGMVHDSIGKDIRILKTLLQAGFYPDIPSLGDKTTALHTAVINREYDEIDLLLSYNADPNLLDSKEVSPLGYAVKNNDLRAIKSLVEAGADADIGFINKFTLGGFALREGYDDAFYYIVESIDDINSLGYDDWSLIHLGARYGSFEVLNNLILRGADPNLLTEANYNALNLVVLQRDEELGKKLKLLVNQGGDVNNVHSGGANPLLAYMDGCYFDIYQSLSDEEQKKYFSVEEFAPEAIYLFDLTEDKFHKNKKNRTPLWYLRRYSSPEQVDHFLSELKPGVIVGEKGYTIARGLALMGYKEQFKAFLEKWSDWEYSTSKGYNLAYTLGFYTEAHWAVKYLLEKGYNPNIEGPGKRHLFNNILYMKGFDLVLWYLENFDINEVYDNENDAPLTRRVHDYLTIKEHTEGLQLIDDFIEKGVVFNPTDTFINKSGSYWMIPPKEISLGKGDDVLVVHNESDKNFLFSSIRKIYLDKNFELDLVFKHYFKGLYFETGNGISTIVLDFSKTTDTYDPPIGKRGEYKIVNRDGTLSVYFESNLIETYDVSKFNEATLSLGFYPRAVAEIEFLNIRWR